MSKSRLGPEAKIISLFTALPDDSKRIVLDIIKSQAAAPRKATAKKPVTSAPAPLPADKEAKCGICGNVKDHADHDRTYLKSHDFEPPKVVARAGRKASKKPGAAVLIGVDGTNDAAIAAGAGD